MRLFRKRTLVRWFTAAALGVAVALLSWYWRYAWLPPGVWEDVAVAAGVRPPEAPFPLLWHALVGPLFDYLGMSRAIRALMLAGNISLGLAAMMVFGILSESLPKILSKQMQRAGWSRRVVRLLIAQGVILFVCSDPVWEAGQAFGPSTFHLLILLFTGLLFVRYAWKRGFIKGWYWTMLLLGMFAGDASLGVLLIIGCLVVCRIKAESNADKLVNPMADPFIRTVTMRRMTLCAIAGWLAVVLTNVIYFCYNGGLEAHDLSSSLYAGTYLYNYWKSFAAACSPSGWLLMTVVVFVPIILSTVFVGAATDDDKFLPYWHAVLFTMMGTMAFLQLSGWRSFWFWSWAGDRNAVPSLLFRCICSLLNAQTFTFALSVLGVEVYFRNYKRIAGIKYQDSVEETTRGAKLAQSLRNFTRLTRFSLFFEPIVLLALVVPYRMQTTVRGIVQAMYDCASLTAAECGDAKYVFTDGTIDTAVELCSREQGHDVIALSLSSGGSSRECYLRGRGALDEEDREMQAANAMDALRTWLRHKQQRMEGVAVQLGFELWAIRRVPLPPVAGMVARPSGFMEGLAEAGAKEARALATRILEIYAKDEELDAASPDLRDMFTRMQWRVARMCRMRGDKLDLSHKTEAAVEESRLADELDAKNADFKRVRQQLEMVGRSGSRLTAREGLKLGMDRADFRMAEMFARQVLFSDPDDLAANFVMGMYYFGNEQYGRAEVFLKKCLEKKPDAAPILNNLAVAQLRQGLLDEAEGNARLALKYDSDSFEARRTLKNVLKEKEAKRQKDIESGLIKGL